MAERFRKAMVAATSYGYVQDRPQPQPQTYESLLRNLQQGSADLASGNRHLFDQH